jgi:hypothetical protein
VLDCTGPSYSFARGPSHRALIYIGPPTGWREPSLDMGPSIYSWRMQRSPFRTVRATGLICSPGRNLVICMRKAWLESKLTGTGYYARQRYTCWEKRLPQSCKPRGSRRGRTVRADRIAPIYRYRMRLSILLLRGICWTSVRLTRACGMVSNQHSSCSNAKRESLHAQAVVPCAAEYVIDCLPGV